MGVAECVRAGVWERMWVSTCVHADVPSDIQIMLVDLEALQITKDSTTKIRRPPCMRMRMVLLAARQGRCITLHAPCAVTRSLPARSPASWHCCIGPPTHVQLASRSQGSQGCHIPSCSLACLVALLHWSTYACPACLQESRVTGLPHPTRPAM